MSKRPKADWRLHDGVTSFTKAEETSYYEKCHAAANPGLGFCATCYGFGYLWDGLVQVKCQNCSHLR